jgi:hypothetical protein
LVAGGIVGAPGHRSTGETGALMLRGAHPDQTPPRRADRVTRLTRSLCSGGMSP